MNTNSNKGFVEIVFSVLVVLGLTSGLLALQLSMNGATNRKKDQLKDPAAFYSAELAAAHNHYVTTNSGVRITQPVALNLEINYRTITSGYLINTYFPEGSPVPGVITTRTLHGNWVGLDRTRGATAGPTLFQYYNGENLFASAPSSGTGYCGQLDTSASKQSRVCLVHAAAPPPPPAVGPPPPPGPPPSAAPPWICSPSRGAIGGVGSNDTCLFNSAKSLPPIDIATLADWQAMASWKKYQLVADLDFAGYSGSLSLEQFVIDGQGHRLTNVTSSLFSNLSIGEIRNLTIEGNNANGTPLLTATMGNTCATAIAAHISGPFDAASGGLIGEMTDSRLENSTVNGNLRFNGRSNAGGVVGTANRSSLGNVSYSGNLNVSGGYAVGGIVGQSTDSHFSGLTSNSNIDVDHASEVGILAGALSCGNTLSGSASGGFRSNRGSNLALGVGSARGSSLNISASGFINDVGGTYSTGTFAGYLAESALTASGTSTITLLTQAYDIGGFVGSGNWVTISGTVHTSISNVQGTSYNIGGGLGSITCGNADLNISGAIAGPAVQNSAQGSFAGAAYGEDSSGNPGVSFTGSPGMSWGIGALNQIGYVGTSPVCN